MLTDRAVLGDLWGCPTHPLIDNGLAYARDCAVSSAHKAGLSLDLRKMHNGTQFLDRPRPRPRLWRAGAELSALDDQKRAGAFPRSASCHLDIKCLSYYQRNCHLEVNEPRQVGHC